MTIELTEHEVDLILGWYGVAEHESQIVDDDSNLMDKIKERLTNTEVV